jgi:hypothetical protein
MDWFSLTQVSISVERWIPGSTVVIVGAPEGRRAASKTEFMTASYEGFFRGNNLYFILITREEKLNRKIK